MVKSTGYLTFLQVGAIAPQSLESLLHSIHECLRCTDWVTRKAASDVLIALAVHSTSLVADKTDSTLTVLEACRFDKVRTPFIISFCKTKLLVLQSCESL